MKCKYSCDMSGPEWAFRSMTRAHRMAHHAVFDKLGLSAVGQPVLLFILNDMRSNGERCTQKELAKLMHLSPSTVTISIKSLERQGYVKKASDESDMRRNFVEITDSGADIAQKCRLAFVDIDKAMYAGFTDAEMEQLTKMFDRITQNLASLSGQDGGCGKEACDKC